VTELIVQKEVLTLEQFADLYRTMVQRAEYPPTKPTAERYLKGLAFICRRVHVQRLASLTAEKGCFYSRTWSYVLISLKT
jgi:hypothetical protein